MKLLTVEFELTDNWEAYIPDDTEKLSEIMKGNCEGAKATIIKTED